MWLPAPFHRWGWDDDYLSQVAASCDQIAVMAYDTGLYLPRAYVWLVRQQVIHATQAAARGNPPCRVLIGVPTYARGGLSHHPYAENIRLALKGVRTRVVFGVRSEGAGKLDGHAWLEAEGEPLLEPVAPDYKVTYSFPA